MIKVYQLRKKQNNYVVTLYYKGVKVKVSFSDGNTYKGTFPKCYTNDPFKQRAIEASQLYKDHDVVLERSIEEPSDAVKKTPSAVSQGTQLQKSDGDVKKDVRGMSADNQDAVDDAEKDSSMEFANLAEAIVYVATTYGQQVQTANEARKVLAEHGVKAVIHK